MIEEPDDMKQHRVLLFQNTLPASLPDFPMALLHRFSRWARHCSAQRWVANALKTIPLPLNPCRKTRRDSGTAATNAPESAEQYNRW
jgi:hypothetical protein